MQFFPFCYSGLQTSAALVFLDSQFCLLNSESPLGSSWAPSPALWPGNSLQTVNWGSWGLIHFLPLRDHCPLLFDVQCLINKYIYIHIYSIYIYISFFGCCRCKDKSGPYSGDGISIFIFLFHILSGLLSSALWCSLKLWAFRLPYLCSQYSLCLTCPSSHVYTLTSSFRHRSDANFSMEFSPGPSVDINLFLLLISHSSFCLYCSMFLLALYIHSSIYLYIHSTNTSEHLLLCAEKCWEQMKDCFLHLRSLRSSEVNG